MPIRFNPSGTLDVGTDPADLPAQAQGKMVVSGAMTRCTNLTLERTGIASTRRGSAKLNPSYDYAYSHAWEADYITGDIVNPFTYDPDLSESYVFTWELNITTEDDPGFKNLTPGAMDQVYITRIIEQAGFRYSFGGTDIYRNESSIKTGLTPADWSAILYNSYTSANQSVFSLNGIDRKRVTETDIEEWGSDYPTQKAVIRIGWQTGLTGVYNVKYTWARKEGDAVVWESNPTSAATAVTLSNQSLQIMCAIPADTQITHIRIYRTAAGGSTYLHDQDISIDWNTYKWAYCYNWEADYVTGTTYQAFITDVNNIGIKMFTWEKYYGDSAAYDYDIKSTFPWESNNIIDTKTADSALGTEASWVNHDRPPLGNVVLGPNFNGICFILKDNNLHYCLPNQPEYWPSEYYIEVSAPQNPLKAGAFLDGVLYLANAMEIYQISGSGAGTFFPLPMSAQTGTVNANCFVAVKGQGIYHLGTDGIYLYSGGKDLLISRGNLDAIFRGENAGNIPGLNRTDISNCWMITYHGRLYIGYPGGTSEYPDNVIVLDLQTQKLVHHIYAATFQTVGIDNLNTRLLAGDIDGYVWKWEDVDSLDDEGTDISWQIQTADFNQLRKYFPRYAKYDVKVGTGATANGYILLDEVSKQTHPLNGDRLTRKRLVDGCTGDRLAVRITGTGAVDIFGVEIE